MNSKISFGYVETEKNGLQPAIHVKLQDSDDTRDRLAKSFFQQLRHTSSWLKVKFEDYIDPQSGNRINITILPIKPEEMSDEVAEFMSNKKSI